MNVNRVTLRALGITGVLLAASLTMLALVSALVTFDAWPTRSGEASASEIAVQPAPVARVVKAVRHTFAQRAAAARRRAAARAATQAAGGGGFAGGALAARGGVASVRSQSGGSPTFVNTPSPQVPHNPPGEGGGGGVTHVQTTPQPTLVHRVCTAAGGVGVAGGVVHAACN